MKRKKIIGIATMLALFCALMAFSFGFVPAVLSTPPENRGVETITLDTVLPDEETQQSGNPANEPYENVAIDTLSDRDDLENQPDINAISMEQAIAIAKNVIAPEEIVVTENRSSRSGSRNEVAMIFQEANYLESSDPASDPVWFVRFMEHTSGYKYCDIPDDMTPEEFLEYEQQFDQQDSDEFYRESRLDKDDEGITIYVLSNSWIRYIVAEINAYTGEFVERWVDDVFHDGELRAWPLEEESPPMPLN